MINKSTFTNKKLFITKASQQGTKRTPIEVSIFGKSMVGFKGLWVHNNFWNFFWPWTEFWKWHSFLANLHNILGMLKIYALYTTRYKMMYDASRMQPYPKKLKILLCIRTFYLIFWDINWLPAENSNSWLDFLSSRGYF